jgi:tRNA threonylcarbamoyladenosine biosynthesis protein TsaB
MTLLCIETSTNCCSAAICVNGQSVAHKDNLTGANHASELPLFVQSLMSEAQEKGWTLDAVALSQGPGSYTGLRIGASLAKGICYALNIPLIPVDTLQVIAAAAIAHLHSTRQVLAEDAILCPLMDARRMEVYTAFYTQRAERTTDIEAKIIDQDAFASTLANSPIYFFGNGADKCKTVLQNENAHFIDDILPQAKYMGMLAEQHIDKQQDIKQLAYYEPFYLKEFIAAPSHIKGLETK